MKKFKQELPILANKRLWILVWSLPLSCSCYAILSMIKSLYRDQHPTSKFHKGKKCSKNLFLLLDRSDVRTGINPEKLFSGLYSFQLSQS